MLRIFRYIFFLMMALFGRVEGSENPSCSISEAPEWVKPISFRSLGADKQTGDEHLRYLLYDIQVDLDRAAHYSHFVKALLTPDAVQEHSMVEIDFDPIYEKIVLHTLAIHRNQKVIDKLATCQKEIIQPERDLDDYQYTGRKSWVILLEDVQKGDVIEYSYSRIGDHPAYKGKYNQEFYLQALNPIDQGNYRIVGSQNRKLYFKTHAGAKEPLYAVLPEGRHEWSWQISDVASYQSDSSTPSWHLGFPAIQASEFANWSDLAQWGSDLFKLPSHFSPEMQELVAQWKNDLPCQEERIVQALRFVQQEIRYLGIEMGSGTHEPSDPSLTLQRRYGDCKDKTLLLKSFLAMMGIDSQPVLVSHSLRGHLSDWHPSVTLFDHVILQISHNEQVQWVDPTLSHQECPVLKKNVCAHYGKGLVLEPKSTDLTVMPTPAPSKILVKTVFTFTSFDEPARFERKISYSGSEADGMRGIYRQYGHKEIEKSYEDYFAGHFGELVQEIPLEVQDDQMKNIFSIKIGYQLPGLWKSDQENRENFFTFYPKFIYDALEFTINPMRQSPLALEYPTHILEQIMVVNKSGQWEEKQIKENFVTDDFALNYEKTADGSQLKYIYELKIKRDHVPQERVVDHHKELQKIEELIFSTISVPMDHDETIADLFEKDNFPLLGGLAVCYAWLIFMLVRKKKKEE